MLNFASENKTKFELSSLLSISLSIVVTQCSFHCVTFVRLYCVSTLFGFRYITRVAITSTILRFSAAAMEEKIKSDLRNTFAESYVIIKSLRKKFEVRKLIKCLRKH